jgi:hypothetical protein
MLASFLEQFRCNICNLTPKCSFYYLKDEYFLICKECIDSQKINSKYTISDKNCFLCQKNFKYENSIKLCNECINSDSFCTFVRNFMKFIEYDKLEQYIILDKMWYPTFLLASKPKKLNDIEELFGNYSIHFTSYADKLNDINFEEEFGGDIDISSSIMDWLPITDFVNHEFMHFYYTMLIVNTNPESCEYKYIALLYQSEGEKIGIKTLYEDIPTFLSDFKQFQDNKPNIDDEYFKRVEEFESKYSEYEYKKFINLITSSFGNYLLTKHKMHETESSDDES